MPKSPKRIAQIVQLLKRELGTILTQDARDPRFADVVISNVDLSPDLSHARIYFTLINQHPPEVIAKALNKAKGYFRSILAKRTALRYVPEIFFLYDQALKNAEHLYDLIDKVAPIESDEPDEN